MARKTRNRKREAPPAHAESRLPREEHEIFADLEALCTSPGFAHAISFFCYRDNLVRYKDELTPDDLAHLHSGSRLIRTEISTLIGLMTRQPIDYTLPAAKTLQDYISRAETLLHELHEALASVWFKDLNLEKAKAGQFNPFSSGEALREPIFYGGDSAYNFQYREFAPKKYARDKEWLQANKGFAIDTALTVASAISALQVEKQIAIPELLKAKPQSEWTVLSAFSFSLDEVITRTGLKPTIVRRIIQAFSIPIADRNECFTALQEFNATNSMPILSMAEDKFILFQHYSLMEAIYEGPFFWMARAESYASEALSNRGKFTEELALECLQRVFGDRVHPNIHLKKSKGEEVGEIDALVLFGDRAIVLQAKSKRLTLAAQKGNDLQVRDDFKKAIQSSYDQALVCAEALIEGGYELLDAGGSQIELATPITQVLPICIVADHYPALAFQARQFLKFKTTENIEAPLVTDVFALDAITEMLETPLRVISYLDLRSRFGHRILYTHELTLLSLHLKYNLWLSTDYDLVSFEADIGVHLDAAMAVRREGISGARTPDGAYARMRSTPVGKILEQIESCADPATIPLGLTLLSLGEKTVATVSKGINFITDESEQDGKNHDFSVLLGESSSGVTIHCNDQPREMSLGRLFSHCRLKKYAEKAREWYGVALSPHTRAIRFGVTLKGDWERDPAMDAAVQTIPAGHSPREIRKKLRTKPKAGRNSPCPCGSGAKYKRCHGKP